jgi:two-component system sensor histidine kinase UhpB
MLPVDGGLAFLTFYPAVITSAALLGTGPGLLATVLSAATADYLFLPPFESFAWRPGHALPLAFFALTCGLTCFLAHRLRSSVSKLRESEERFRGGFDFAAIGMALVAPDLRWLRVNRALCDIVGYTAEDLLATNVLAITHPDDRDEEIALVRRMLDGEFSQVHKDKRYVRKEGDGVWVHLSVSLARDAEGRPSHFFCQIQNISARKEAEERFRGAFEFAAVGMALVGPDGRFLRVNDSVCRILGYSADELLATTFGALTHPDDLERDTRYARQLLDGSFSHRQMEKRYFHKDGHIVWALLSVSLVRDAAGQPLYFVSQIQDITERKRLEHAFGEATHKEHQRLGQEIHDGLGQELTGLSYLASALAKDATRSHSPLAEKLTILAGVAARTVETCRNIARGVSPLTESRGSLVESLRRIAERAAAIGRAGVGFESIEKAPLTIPWKTRDHLHRITQEALNNALRHSGANNTKVTIEIDQNVVRIEVVDNGRGLGGPGTTPTGVGLDSMRQRAAAIGAVLRIERRVGGGTVVVCECPQPWEGPGG